MKKLTSQDKKEFEKYARIMAHRAMQIIVQSRLGEKTATPCKPKSAGTDWFNLNIAEIPEITLQTKHALQGGTLTTRAPLIVEISLQTSDGDQMALETWCLSLLPEKCDAYDRLLSATYYRMTLLLKTLLSVSKAPPAYRLSRNQSADTYVILYRIVVEQPNFHCLGDGYKGREIGRIVTPIGTILLKSFERTNMTLSPTQTGRTNSIMLKSDHFDTSPRNSRRKPNEVIDLSKPIKPGAFADINFIKEQKIIVQQQLPIVTHLLSLGQKKLTKSKSDDDDNENESDKNNSEDDTELIEKTEIMVIDDEKLKNETNKNCKEKNLNNNNNHILNINNNNNNSTTIIKSKIEDLVKSQEYWMKPLSVPFSDGGEATELMTFYRLVCSAPALELNEAPLTEEDVKKQLDVFESKLPEYNELVESLYQSPDN